MGRLNTISITLRGSTSFFSWKIYHDSFVFSTFIFLIPCGHHSSHNPLLFSLASLSYFRNSHIYLKGKRSQANAYPCLIYLGLHKSSILEIAWARIRPYLNGHTVAGGFIMAAAGEYRLMAKGPFKIGLMEIDIGLAAPIGPVQMLNHVFGGHLADRILLGGELYRPEEALALGLVDEVLEPDALMERAIDRARLLGSKPSAGYRRLKHYLRQAVVERMRSLDEIHLDELVEQWFTEDTQARLTVAVKRLTEGSTSQT